MGNRTLRRSKRKLQRGRKQIDEPCTGKQRHEELSFHRDDGRHGSDDIPRRCTSYSAFRIYDVPVTEDRILTALRGVLDPELGGDIVELGMVQSVDADPDGSVTIGIALTIAACPMRDRIEQDVIRKVSALEGVTGVKVETRAMDAEQRSQLMAVARRRARDNAKPTNVSPLTRVVAVGSGKGGVGKSSVSVNLSLALADLGHRVGLLDADIWGFSIPRLIGTHARLSAGEDRLLIPVNVSGIQVVSTGLIVESEDTALMWRGLMLSKALEQFLNQVAWADDLGYLVIDLPPGTGDVQMALSRMLPQAELVVVTTPQIAARNVAARAANMARRSFLPLLGVIENMAGFTCEHGTTYDLFGKGGGQTLADDLGVPLIGQIPLDPLVVADGDAGLPIVRAHPESPAAAAFRDAAARLADAFPPAGDETCVGRIARILEDLEVPAR
ncbi:MAG TPA: MRP family ATP-binding protein [Actinobacteria bacterium]|nr:MRP family ATP-binding protein [Actinomycetota bacterium]